MTTHDVADLVWEDDLAIFDLKLYTVPAAPIAVEGVTETVLVWRFGEETTLTEEDRQRFGEWLGSPWVS